MMKYKTGVCCGKSMHPVIKEGWRIKAVYEQPENIKIGDIVVFGKDSITCHRVIGKFKNGKHSYFMHKGDNSFIGGIFEGKNLIGKAVCIFDNEERKVDNPEKPKSYPKYVKMFYHCYFIMYLAKRYIWGDDTNKLICYIDRIFWSFLSKCNKTL